MSKAEERALEAYPMVGSEAKDMTCWQYDNRKIYLKGYHQAEKDLVLTRDDIELIGNLLIASWHMPSGEDIYEEVLKRFNETRALTNK